MSNRPRMKPHQTAMKDQWDAATREARGHVDAVGAILGYPIEPTVLAPTGIANYDQWLHKITTGDLELCPHLPSPTPCLGLTAEPGRVWCPACARGQAERHTRLHPTTCDGCNQVVTNNMFRETMTNLGPIMVAGNLCDDCHQALHPEAA